MANDGSCNCNNGDNNDIESPSSTLEQLLIIHAQLPHIVQQIMVQMQDVNQLMQSMEVRPSSRKRKSNTHDDASYVEKTDTTKVPTTKRCYNCTDKGHYTHRCPNDLHILNVGNQNMQKTSIDQNATQNPMGKKWYNCG
jgi:hypothetical protein